MDWSNDCNHANGLCEWEHYPTSGLPPTRGVWCVVVFENFRISLGCRCGFRVPSDEAVGVIMQHH